MRTLNLPRLASWLLALGAVALLAPSVCRADPVEDLRRALKQIDDKNTQVAVARIKLAVPELKTIGQLRRAYFLSEWPFQIIGEANNEIDGYRTKIGASLKLAIRKAAEDTTNKDRLIALAILIAEMAETDKAENPTGNIEKKATIAREKNEKFVRELTDVVVELTKVPDLPVRQAALNALGKITPDPKVAMPVLKNMLQKGELGPRRLAAYALVDLLKNIDHHKRPEQIKLLDDVIHTAVGGLRDADELTRGYCLQAIEDSARAFNELFSLVKEGEKVTEKEKLDESKKILRAFQAANTPLAQALGDPELRIKLATLQALDEIGFSRLKIIAALEKITPEKKDQRVELLKLFDVPDPLADIIERDWRSIAGLLSEKNDVALRRAAISFFEQLGYQAEPAAEEISQALFDPNPVVRLTATRTIRNIPPQKVSPKAIAVLAKLLTDPDPDISLAAAESLEVLGPVAQATVDSLAAVIASNADPENQVQAMKALVSIGLPSAQKAIPNVLSALTGTDVRVRREAAYALGQLGRPSDTELTNRVLAALKNALRDDDPEVRLNASEAILTIAPTRKGL